MVGINDIVPNEPGTPLTTSEEPDFISPIDARVDAEAENWRREVRDYLSEAWDDVEKAYRSFKSGISADWKITKDNFAQRKKNYTPHIVAGAAIIALLSMGTCVGRYNKRLSNVEAYMSRTPTPTTVASPCPTFDPKYAKTMSELAQGVRRLDNRMSKLEKTVAAGINSAPTPTKAPYTTQTFTATQTQHPTYTHTQHPTQTLTATRTPTESPNGEPWVEIEAGEGQYVK